MGPAESTSGSLPAVTSTRPTEHALADAEATLHTLHTRCCEPGRSPRMTAVGETLAAARFSLERLQAGEETADTLLGALEEAGAQIGRLQIACCAPDRVPLYAHMLQRLTEVQLEVTRSLGSSH